MMAKKAKTHQPNNHEEPPPLDHATEVSRILSTNKDNKYILIDALAGTGKTTLLLNLISKLHGEEILLLSFANQSINVIHERAPKGVHAQTFDSFFYHAVHTTTTPPPLPPGQKGPPPNFDMLRDQCTALTPEALNAFVCNATAKYALAKVKYVVIDEAQDSPPQARHVLETLRSMGKTILVAGDDRQSIFKFMQTQSLFDTIPTHDKHTYQLFQTRRCCREVVDFVNRRFHLHMQSSYLPHHKPEAIESICFQCLYNASLGRIYVKLLFSLNTVFKVHVSEGDSADKFWEAVYEETKNMYSLASLKRAKDAVKDRQKTLEGRFRDYDQTPRKWRPPTIIVSTVHSFKGGEADITVIGADVELTASSLHPENENLKYVAATRPRWGIVDMHRHQWHGHALARQLFYDTFVDMREIAISNRGMPPRISSVSDHPSCVVALIASPTLAPMADELSRTIPRDITTLDQGNVPKQDAMTMGSLADILMGWTLERDARRHGVPSIDVGSSEYKAKPVKDKTYAFLKRQQKIPYPLDLKLRLLVARLKLRSVFGRYLVVFGDYAPWHPLILKCALAKSQLQSFCMCCNLRVLQESSATVNLACRKRLVEMFHGRQLPGILGSPSEWQAVCIQQALPANSAFFFRGAYDVLIVDHAGTRHLVEMKTVKTITPAHVLQTTLYTTVLYVSMGRRGTWQSCIYEANRNSLFPLEVSRTLHFLSQDDFHLQELSVVLYTKTLPQYYPDSLSLEHLFDIAFPP